MSQHKKLPLAWLANKTPEEIESIEYSLRNNSNLITTLLDLIDHMDKEEINSAHTLKEYESPSWAYKQADRNGARRAYNKIKQLFNYMETTH